MVLRYKQQLGAAMRARRDELGLTQKQVAEAAHIEVAQTVSRWERGVTMPSDLEAVAAALQTTIPQLMVGISPPARVAHQVDIAPAEPDAPLAERLARMELRLEEIYALLTTGAQTDAVVAPAGAALLEEVESQTPPARRRSATPRPGRRPRSA